MHTKKTASIHYVSLNLLGYGIIKQTAQRLFTRDQRLWGLDSLIKSIKTEWIRNQKIQTPIIIDFYGREGGFFCSEAISKVMLSNGIGQVILDIKSFPRTDKTIIRSLKYLFRWLAQNGVSKDKDQTRFQFRLNYTLFSESKEECMDAQGISYSLPSFDLITDKADATVQFVNAADLRKDTTNFPYRTNLNSSDKVAIVTLKFS